MKTYYFASKDDELCYSLEYHIENAKEQGLTEIELYKAVPERMTGMFFCRLVDCCGEEGDCGKFCEGYEPKNGKSGMCRHKSNKFFTHGDKLTFKI